MPIPAANQILPFADGGGANVESQAAYAADAQLPLGNQPGIARSSFNNKAFKQVSKIAAAIAQFIANRQATDVTDALTTAQIDLMLATAMGAGTTAVINGASTADALIANFTPTATTRIAGIQIAKALADNATTTPTLARDAQAAKTMVKGGNAALVAGDIKANGLIAFYYDPALDKEVLLNPATGVTPSTASKISMSPITATAAASALTIAMALGINVDFRSATAASGLVTQLISTALTLTVPNGATLGTVNNVAARLAVLAINNAGVMELAVANMGGGLNLSGSGTINTTAISGASNSASTIYSTTARTGVTYQIVGYIDIIQTAAGAWVNNPTVVQPGGSVAAILAAAGFSKWINLTGSRSAGSTFYNQTGRDVWVSIIGFTSASTDEWVATIDGVVTVRGGYAGTTLYSTMSILFKVPAGSSYALSSSGGAVQFWFES